MQSLSSFQEKKPKIFPCRGFLFRVIVDCLLQCPNSKKTPLPWEILGYTPVSYVIMKEGPGFIS